MTEERPKLLLLPMPPDSPSEEREALLKHLDSLRAKIEAGKITRVIIMSGDDDDVREHFYVGIHPYEAIGWAHTFTGIAAGFIHYSMVGREVVDGDDGGEED